MNNGKICISVCAKTIAEVREQITRAEPFADVIELRFDCLNADQLRPANLVFDSTKHLVCTFRPTREGGHTQNDEIDRLEFWKDLASDPRFRNAWFDLESDVISAVDISSARKIASFHDFLGVPEHINEIFESLIKGGDVSKIAVHAADAVDAMSVWHLLERGKTVIPIAMGEGGKWTRILGPAYGAFLTYASLGTGSETAPGQISARDMLKLYRVNELDKDTLVYGIIGDPVSQSLSPHMHNPAFASRQINSVFIPFLIKDLDAFVRRMLRPATSEVGFELGGLSVTMPHKQAIMKYLDEMDETALSIGAVNTIKVEDGKLIGYNTDALGFITPLKKAYGDLKGARVSIFGSGGAARACIYSLKNEGAAVTLFARDADKARSLANDFGIGLEQISDAKNQNPKTSLSNFDILVDATPYGMGDLANQTLFTAEELTGLKFVYDLVTKPFDTPIIREAKLAGIPTIGGLEMLIAQGVEQFRIWTGHDVSTDEMKGHIMS